MNARLIMADVILQKASVSTPLEATTVHANRDTSWRKIVNSSVKVGWLQRKLENVSLRQVSVLRKHEFPPLETRRKWPKWSGSAVTAETESWRNVLNPLPESRTRRCWRFRNVSARGFSVLRPVLCIQTLSKAWISCICRGRMQQRKSKHKEKGALVWCFHPQETGANSKEY